MFATINTISEPENFWGKIKYNLLPPPVKAERVEVDEGSDFIKLTVPIIRGKIYWNNVRSAAGDASRNLIMPNRISVHEQIDLKQFQSERFMTKLTVNSFFRLLKLMPKNKLLGECAVIDFTGSLADEIKELPKYCRTVKIITLRGEKYNLFSDAAMNEYGCAVQLSEDIVKSFSSEYVLFAKKAERPTAFSRRSKVFASSPENIYTSNLFIPEGVSLPQKYFSLMPKGINPMSFAAALYEISSVSSLASCFSPAYRKNNQILSYKDVISMLDY